MRKLLLLLILLAAPASAQTRLYLNSRDLPDVYPAASGTWNTTTNVKWRYLSTSAGTIAMGNSPDGGSVTTFSHPTLVAVSGLTADYVYVSAPLASGTFTSGSTTVTMQVPMAESNADDDVDRCIMGVRIMDSTGTSTVTTLLSVAFRGATSELIATSTFSNNRNKKCAVGNTVTASHTVTPGERLVVEYGFQNSSGTGVTPSARSGTGLNSYLTSGAGAPSDCGIDETGTPCKAWIEFSNAITFSARSRVGQRFVLHRTKDQGVTPSPDGAWNTTTGFFRRRMDATGVGTATPSTLSGSTYDFTGNVALTAASSTAKGLHTQYISLPMAAGVAFGSGVRVTIVTSMRENDATADVTKCLSGVRIVSSDGSTVRATLAAVGNYDISSGVEGSDYDGTDGSEPRTCMDSRLIDTTYTTVLGDRIVVELGCGTGAAAATPRCAFFTGDNNFFSVSGTNQTNVCLMGYPIQLVAGASGQHCASWIDFAGVQWAAAPDPSPGPRRVYFPASTAADISPAINAGWTVSNELIRRQLGNTRGTSSIAIGQVVDMTEDITQKEIDRQYVSVALNPGTTFTAGYTTVTGQVQARASAVGDGIIYAASSIRVVNSSGVAQAELLPANGWFFDRTTSNVTSTDWLVETVVTGRTLIAPGTPLAASYTSVSGDRLVIEIGGATLNANTSPQYEIRYGENAADCVTMDNTSTASCAPWVEFSNAITFVGEGRPQSPWFARFLMANPIGIFRSLVGRWLR